MNRLVAKGIGLVEVIIAAAIILGVITALVTVNNIYIRVSTSTIKSVKAQMLLQEGVEAIRIIRDGGWTANIAPLTNGTTYYLVFTTSTNRWAATTTPYYVDGMKRTFRLASVYRDANGDISVSGTTDNGTRKVDMTIEWAGYQGTSTETISTYISNLYKE